jgi:hypothetical protein
MITVVPVGGLANRMRAIDAAVALAQDVNTGLRIIWYKDRGLNCRFDQLFESLHLLPAVELREASFTDLLLYDRPRKKNFHVPRIYQRFKFDACIYEDEATSLYFRQFDFKQWAKGRNVYIASCIYFHVQPEREQYKIFQPLPELQQKINRTTQQFNAHTWGVHIRRTDNTFAISESPTEVFIAWMEKQIQQHEDTLFYLATDSEEDKAIMKNIFGQRIITSDAKAERNTLIGMQNALIEMYVLSGTQGILGSFYSSYSDTAALIGGIPLQIAQKDNKIVAMK